MSNVIEHKIKTVRTSAASESRRLIELVGEAEGNMATPSQQECAFFAYSICLNSRRDLDSLLTAVREVETALAQHGKTKSRPGGNELIRLNVETALIERQMKSITSNLNAARSTLDGVVDIWGARQPTGGLWDK